MATEMSARSISGRKTALITHLGLGLGSAVPFPFVVRGWFGGRCRCLGSRRCGDAGSLRKRLLYETGRNRGSQNCPLTFLLDFQAVEHSFDVWICSRRFAGALRGMK